MITYKIITETFDKITAAVNEKIQQGWQLYGSPFTYTGRDTTGYTETLFAQAVTKE